MACISKSLIILVLILNISCDDNNLSQKELLMPEIEHLSTVNKQLVGVGNDNMYVWDWTDLSESPAVCQIDTTYAAYITGGYAIIDLPTNHPLYKTTPIVCRKLKDENFINKWSLDKEWFTEHIAMDRNGKSAIVHIIEDYWYLKQKSRKDAGGHRIGLVDPNSKEINWLTTFFEGECGPMVHRLDLSENNKYVVVVGANNGGWIMVIDVEKKKVIWEQVPSWSVNFNDVCFSMDSKTIYIGGNGGVYHFDIKTGKVTWPWSEMEERCVGITVSPDGRLIAAGAVASGNLYIIDVKTGKTIKKIQTGQYTLYNVAFSPDSKLLATGGVKSTNVKIWKMPQ